MADGSHERRDFFRAFLQRVVDPVADYAEKRLPQERTLLRPPGALPEREFLNTCYHCGNCADSCPANAIVNFRGEDEDLRGTPFIDPERQSCVVCDGLQCMHACPSGALVPTPLEQINMGLAHVTHATCLRSHGENCQQCIEVCPTPTKALRVDAQGQIEVIAECCIGCGLCQSICPTENKAINVQPN